MTRYAAIFERGTDGSWWARAADLPVFVAGDTREEAEELLREGIALHLESLRTRGEPIPTFDSEVGMVSV